MNILSHLWFPCGKVDEATLSTPVNISTCGHSYVCLHLRMHIDKYTCMQLKFPYVYSFLPHMCVDICMCIGYLYVYACTIQYLEVSVSCFKENVVFILFTMLSVHRISSQSCV